MNMIEKVARAMADRSKARVVGMHTLNALPMNGDEDFMLLAVAAIEAMRPELDHWAMVLENYDISLADEMRKSFAKMMEE
jgi:hypothetical protein